VASLVGVSLAIVLFALAWWYLRDNSALTP